VIRVLLLLATLQAVSACAEEPTPKEADKAAKATIAEDTAGAVKQQKKSIEEAAEAAVKLIEEEARQEIEESARAQDIVETDKAAETKQN
jgi:hypothetical protein